MNQPGRRPPSQPAAVAWLQRFAKRYGWRAYALPVLAVVTIVALIPGGNGASSDAAGRTDGSAPPSAAGGVPTASADGRVKIDDTGANSVPQVEDAAALPPGGPYATEGAGTFSVVSGEGAVAGSGPLRRYTIEYENGVSGLDFASVAATIEGTLSDPRSWTAGGAFSLQRVDSGPVDFRITITSAMTVRELCGYEQEIETSCFDPATERVVLNDARWVRGAAAYATDIATYRLYMVNHETGHALGFGHITTCLPDGKAPIMMQQTISVRSESGQTCRPNPWPNPTS